MFDRSARRAIGAWGSGGGNLVSGRKQFVARHRQDRQVRLHQDKQLAAAKLIQRTYRGFRARRAAHATLRDWFDRQAVTLAEIREEGARRVVLHRLVAALTVVFNVGCSACTARYRGKFAAKCGGGEVCEHNFVGTKVDKLANELRRAALGGGIEDRIRGLRQVEQTDGYTERAARIVELTRFDRFGDLSRLEKAAAACCASRMAVRRAEELSTDERGAVVQLCRMLLTVHRHEEAARRALDNLASMQPSATERDDESQARVYMSSVLSPAPDHRPSWVETSLAAVLGGVSGIVAADSSQQFSTSVSHAMRRLIADLSPQGGLSRFLASAISSFTSAIGAPGAEQSLQLTLDCLLTVAASHTEPPDKGHANASSPTRRDPCTRQDLALAILSEPVVVFKIQKNGEALAKLLATFRLLLDGTTAAADAILTSTRSTHFGTVSHWVMGNLATLAGWQAGVRHPQSATPTSSPIGDLAFNIDSQSLLRLLGCSTIAVPPRLLRKVYRGASEVSLALRSRKKRLLLAPGERIEDLQGFSEQVQHIFRPDVVCLLLAAAQQDPPKDLPHFLNIYFPSQPRRRPHQPPLVTLSSLRVTANRKEYRPGSVGSSDQPQRNTNIFGLRFDNFTLPAAKRNPAEWLCGRRHVPWSKSSNASASPSEGSSSDEDSSSSKSGDEEAKLTAASLLIDDDDDDDVETQQPPTTSVPVDVDFDDDDSTSTMPLAAPLNPGAPFSFAAPPPTGSASQAAATSDTPQAAGPAIDAARQAAPVQVSDAAKTERLRRGSEHRSRKSFSKLLGTHVDVGVVHLLANTAVLASLYRLLRHTFEVSCRSSASTFVDHCFASSSSLGGGGSQPVAPILRSFCILLKHKIQISFRDSDFVAIGVPLPVTAGGAAAFEAARQASLNESNVKRSPTGEAGEESAAAEGRGGTSWPFGLAELKWISLFLNEIAFLSLKRCLSGGGGHGVSENVKAEAHLCKLFCAVVNLLYDRNAIVKFIDDAAKWTVPEASTLLRNRYQLLQQDLIADDDEILESLSAPTDVAASRSSEELLRVVLRLLPQAVHFDDRVLVFHHLINSDRKNYAQNRHVLFATPPTHVIRRSHIVTDGLENLDSLPIGELKGQVRIQFVGEEGLVEDGVDGGGLVREFMIHLLRTAVDPSFGLFTECADGTFFPSPGAYHNHPDAEELFHFLGKVVGKALYEKHLMEPQFNPVFLGRLLGRVSQVDDLLSVDPELHRNLLFLRNYRGELEELALTFSVATGGGDRGRRGEVDLIPNGRNVQVTQKSKMRFVELLSQYKCDVETRALTEAFADGLRRVIHPRWFRMFNQNELQTLISGSPCGIDVEDLKRHSVLGGGYTAESVTVKHFWRVLASLSDEQQSQVLAFVTSCSRQPLLGFRHMRPPFTIHQVRDKSRLPSAATCINQLKLPDYQDESILCQKLLKAVTMGGGFGLS